MNRKLFIILLVLLVLPFVLINQQQIQQLLSRAAYKPANIIVETRNALGPLNNSWAAFSQGGEEAPLVLSPVVSKMKELQPKLIRIDHIFDFHNVVKKSGSEYSYDFSLLDKVVDDIIAMGAIPFFSLSYMPPVFTENGSVTGIPTDWNNWKDLIRATIERYSGKNNRNLSDVYYEVWNEPELPQFGKWEFFTPRDYRSLYFYAAAGAKEALNVNNFFLGGPAVGSFYADWVTNFVSYVSQNNLRLDFYSWHRYTKKPPEYASDARKIRNLLSSFPTYANIPLILSEWGIDSENNDLNNQNVAAAYTISAISQFKDINLAFNFEVKDGPPPAGGKWGLLTHEKNTNQPVFAKPKFRAFSALAKMSGNQLLSTGDGTYVSGIAGTSKDKISVILSNYDLTGKNIENVPVTFTGLDPAIYYLRFAYVLDDRSGFYEIPATSGSINKSFLMPANSLLYLELTRGAKLATFVNGLSVNTNDKALILNNIEGPLTFSYPEFNLLPTGSITFDLKPFWDKNDNRSFFILEAPFAITSGLIDKLSLSKQKNTSGNSLIFTVTQNKEEISLSYPIDNWEMNLWHHIILAWNQNELSITVDGIRVNKSVILDIRNGKTMTFSPIEAALDNIKIFAGKDQIIERKFDGRIDN